MPQLIQTSPGGYGAAGVMAASMSDKRRKILSALRQQRRSTTFTPYFSRVRFNALRTGAGPYTYTVPGGTELRCFSYGLGQDMGPAGRPGVTATSADTNIVTGGRTIGGQAVEVSGLSVQVQSNTTAVSLVKQVWPDVSIKLALNGGENTFLLGTPSMLPGASGLYGSAQDSLSPQPIPGGRPFEGMITNGLPGQHNQAAIPEGWVWMPEGEQDSTLNILFRMERDAVFVGQLADEVAAAGIRGYTNPTAAQVFVDILVRLHGRVVGPRSNIV